MSAGAEFDEILGHRPAVGDQHASALVIDPGEQFALGGAHEAFDEGGALVGERQRGGVEQVVASVLRLTRALA